MIKVHYDEEDDCLVFVGYPAGVKVIPMKDHKLIVDYIQNLLKERSKECD